MSNLFGFSVFMPADPNQTDRIVRYVATQPGNFFVGMGRSKIPMVLNEKGEPAFAGSYRFVPGKADWLRRGGQGAILAYGSVLHNALQARDELARSHGLELSVINFASLTPFDSASIVEAARTGLMVTVEDHHVNTGLGAKVALALADLSISCKLVRQGVSSYGGSGKPEDLYRLQGIDASGIVKSVLEARSSICPPA
jgi:transketolase